MKCQVCSAPASVHLTDIVGGKKREVHLCQKCAEEQNVVSLKSAFGLQSLLEGLLKVHVGTVGGPPAGLSCPSCGIKYKEFRSGGRLGCPADYDVFQQGLMPLLDRIHGATQHRGKRPCRQGSGHASLRHLIQLQRQLQGAVADERFEEAARLRDLIREEEREIAGQSGGDAGR